MVYNAHENYKYTRRPGASMIQHALVDLTSCIDGRPHTSR